MRSGALGQVAAVLIVTGQPVAEQAQGERKGPTTLILSVPLPGAFDNSATPCVWTKTPSEFTQ